MAECYTSPNPTGYFIAETLKIPTAHQIHHHEPCRLVCYNYFVTCSQEMESGAFSAETSVEIASSFEVTVHFFQVTLQISVAIFSGYPNSAKQIQYVHDFRI